MNKKIIGLIIVFFSAANFLSAFELPQMTLENISLSEMDIPAPPAKATKITKTIKPAEIKSERINVWMQIRGTGFMSETEADDTFARINIKVRKVFDDEYDIQTRVDMDNDWMRIRNFFSDNYRLTGTGYNLEMRKSFDDYAISGTILMENQHKYINLGLNKRFHGDENEFSYYISNLGINLTIDDRSITGYFDTAQYSKKSVAAVIALVLALHDKTFNKPDEFPDK